MKQISSIAERIEKVNKKIDHTKNKTQKYKLLVNNESDQSYEIL